MSVLIKGMTMPKGNEIITIFPDGTAQKSLRGEFGTAVPVPPHGRLIDADAPIRLEIKIDGGMNMCVTDIYAPTVIEAEGGDAQ